MKTKVIAFDAMGVLYQSQDDVADHLVPYLRDNGCPLSDQQISSLYLDCSLGRLSSKEFWRRCAVVDDNRAYTSRHELTIGVAELLQDLSGRGFHLACLSNDVAEWSVLLRARFGLDRWITSWVISGEIGVRKPDEQAYLELVRAVNTEPGDIMFVDDRRANVSAACELGMRAVEFSGLPSLTAEIEAWV